MNLYNFHQSSTYTSYPFVICIPFVGRGHLGAPLQGLGQKPSSPVGILFWGVGTLHSSRLGPQLKQFSKRVAGRFCDLFENDFAVAPLHPNLIQPWHVFTHQSIKAGFGMSQETALQLFFDMTRRFVRPSETWQREKNGRFLRPEKNDYSDKYRCPLWMKTDDVLFFVAMQRVANRLRQRRACRINSSCKLSLQSQKRS